MKICFVTGGTGGHIYPALALADKMKELDSSTEILFIGNDDRMEKDLIPQNGYAFKALHTSGLVGNAFKKCMAVCQMFKAEGKAKKIFERIQARYSYWLWRLCECACYYGSSFFRYPYCNP